MVKMADTYMEEEYYEKAYILYLKYLTLFIEKVRTNFWTYKIEFENLISLIFDPTCTA